MRSRLVISPTILVAVRTGLADTVAALVVPRRVPGTRLVALRLAEPRPVVQRELLAAAKQATVGWVEAGQSENMEAEGIVVGGLA